MVSLYSCLPTELHDHTNVNVYNALLNVKIILLMVMHVHYISFLNWYCCPHNDKSNQRQTSRVQYTVFNKG